MKMRSRKRGKAMSKPQWTEDQQKVIDLRNRNILVSAAAGSGKTAVLVERIITMICDKEHPVDIDHLLIVTFTNAAAAEMKERIGNAIEAKIRETPEDVHLQKQMALIHSAQITTIHSFCLHVIRNYFNTIDLDPSFRIAQEAELQLLRSDVVNGLLEKEYETLSPDFTELVESYATGKSDASLESLIIQLYQFSISYPWPKEWLEEKRNIFALETLEELENTEIMAELKSYLKAIIRELNRKINRALDLCDKVAGPYMYKETLQKEEAFINALLTKDSYQEYAEVFETLSWDRLSAKRDKNVDPSLREEVKAIRDDIKKTMNDLEKAYFFQPVEEMLEDIKGVKAPMNALIHLTIAFSEEYARQKEERGIVDFNDLEHYALQILVNKEEVKPTLVAMELSEEYDEILIDEYQDSNLVQELILNSISKEKFGTPNVFMVGDVKQSIYKFRMARPELFMKKYNTYPTEDSSYQRIDLHKNFRSRDVVLTPINYIFEQIMTKELGGIIYDDKAALHVGANYPEGEGLSEDTELLLVGEGYEYEESVEEQNEIDAEEESVTDYTSRELEAKAIAKRMKELVDPVHGMKITTKEKDQDGNPIVRIANYSDMVILLRSMSGWSDVFIDVLMAEGITAFAETQTGYFSTLEIRTILNLLRVLDNPRQEIPLAAVLHSPIYQFTSEELAIIKVGQKERELYDALRYYREQGEEEILKKKIHHFLNQLEQYRSMVTYTPIYELIQFLVEDTRYYYYVQALPAGERRSGNIDMLIQQAIDFEGTSFSGLFDFIRYIEKLQKYDIDFGEAVVSSEADNTVRIMTIHKSKGLEFPIVFVAGMSKQFNTQDARSKLVLHPDLGIGPEYVNTSLRIKSPTIMKKIIAKQVVLENLAEELRVFYVALTRAKEKLIMTGYIKDLDKFVARYEKGMRTDQTLSYQTLTSANSYLDFVLPAVQYHKNFLQMMETLCGEQEEEKEQKSMIDPASENVPFQVYFVDVFTLLKREVTRTLEHQVNKEELQQFDTRRRYDEEKYEELERQLTYQYPYYYDTTIQSKVTVSELKRLGQYMDQDESVVLIEEQEEEIPEENRIGQSNNQVQDSFDPTIPNFIKKRHGENVEQTMKATELGTLYHRFLQHLNFTKVSTKEQLKEEANRLILRGLFTEEDVKLLEEKKLLGLITGEIGRRMAEAQKNGLLYREQPFVMGQPAASIHERYQSEEMILIQGIIDVFWEEEDGLVLLDYKTDKVKYPGQLVNRYKVQLEYYKQALEKMSHKKVKDVYIYSLTLEEAIKVYNV